MANYTRACKIMKTIPEYNDAQECIDMYEDYIESKKISRAKVGRILMIILGALIVLAVIIPPVVDKVNDVIDGSKLTYYYVDNNQALAVGCKNNSVKNIKIPIEYKNFEIREIKADAFYGCEALTTVEIPETVQEIGENAFKNCRSLEVIRFGGTTYDWKAITKGEDWDKNTGNYIVECIDGTLFKSDSYFDFDFE